MLHPHLELFPKAINRLRHIEKILLERGIKPTHAGMSSDTELDVKTKEFLGQRFGYVHFVILPKTILTWSCFVSTSEKNGQTGDMHVQVDLGFRDDPGGEFITGFVVKYNEVTRVWIIAYEPADGVDESVVESEPGTGFAEHFQLALGEQLEVSKKEAYTIIKYIAQYFVSDAAGNQ